MKTSTHSVEETSSIPSAVSGPLSPPLSPPPLSMPLAKRLSRESLLLLSVWLALISSQLQFPREANEIVTDNGNSIRTETTEGVSAGYGALR